MVLFVVLALTVFSAGVKLLVNVKEEFPHLYAAIRIKVFAITLGGTLAMLFRAFLSFTVIVSPTVYDDFKQESLMSNSAGFPVFLVSFVLVAEIQPIVCFLVFLMMSITNTE